MDHSKGMVVFVGKTKDLGLCITELSSSAGQQRLETGFSIRTQGQNHFCEGGLVRE